MSIKKAILKDVEDIIKFCKTKKCRQIMMITRQNLNSVVDLTKVDDVMRYNILSTMLVTFILNAVDDLVVSFNEKIGVDMSNHIKKYIMEVLIDYPPISKQTEDIKMEQIK